ncbi:reverse transcriptase domain-containing protein [Tanacetum coccineum]|uniref:Reverse transcriptase domain-containing protein n=1 Tax=Tanacetum coccineum TaxID=301880 RepID=A0ABQ5A8M6_9ASTR
MEGKKEAQQQKFLENLKQLHINIPFIEALVEMPKYAKYLKSLLTNKSRLEEACTVTMNERCSIVLLNKLPSQEKDLGSFTIPCQVSNLQDNALADLGASISFMPYKMYEKLDMPEDSRIPIVLERPFLATARVMIDVFNKKITLRVGDDEVIIDMDQSIKNPLTNDDEFYNVNDLDDTINEESYKLLENDQVDSFLLDIAIRRIDSVDTAYSEEQKNVVVDTIKNEHLYLASANEIDEKKPKLKDLPSHLEEKKSFLQVLEKHKGSITWKMSDIKGISPSFCTHEILKEDDFKPVIQPQRHLNPKVQDVVTNEIFKLLDSGLIYPISDSSIFLDPNCARRSRKYNVYLPYGTFAYRRMSFGLCNAPATFQRCMAAIFHDMVEDFMEVFTDDFSIRESPHGGITEREIADEFPDEHLMMLKAKVNDVEPWYADYVNYIVGKVVPPKWTFERRKGFYSQVKNYFWDEPYAFKFEVPKALISDRGTYFCNSQLERSLQKYGVTHKLSTAYHPQSNRQTKVTNRAIKRILERSVGYNPKDWSEKLNDSLWAFKTTYKTPTGCTPFRLVYGKACHLSVEIEHKAYWALKQCNMDLIAASKNRFMYLNELAELRDRAYENTRIYKERTKKWHDSRLRGDKDFIVGDKITDKNGFSFKVNGQRLKKYYEGNVDKEDDEVIEFEADAT